MYPVLFHIYGYEIYTYPLIVFIGLLVTAWVFSRLCRQKKTDINLLSDYIFLVALVVLLFARAGGVIESFDVYLNNPLHILYFFDGAYNFYSGTVGLLLILFVLTFLKRENFWKWLDIVAQSFFFFFFFLAFADFLSGANYGGPSDLPWAVSFNLPEVRYTVPVHPVQLYEAIGIFFLFFVLIFRSKKKYEEGALAVLIFFSFFLLEALLSFFRGEAETLVLGFKLSFLLSLFFSICALVTFVLKTHPNMHLLHHQEHNNS